MEARREEFRKYLEETGVITALTKALVKLYEMKYDRPECAISFVQQHMADNTPSMAEYENLLNELKETKAALIAFQGNSSPDQQLQTQQCSVGGNLEAQSATMRKDTVASSESIKNAKNLVMSLLDDPDCNSLLKKHLTIALFDKLKNLKTSFGTRLLDCINSGLINHKSSIGIYAADSEAYDTFGEIFIPIIEDYHGFTSDMTHPAADWGDVSSFENLDPGKELIISTRIRCARSVGGFALNPLMSEQNYLTLMEKVTAVLLNLDDELKGTWYALEEMDGETKQKMIDDHYLFKEGDKYLEAAGATKFWPKGRGIFMNEAKTFSVWLNEEDHLRFISMETGGDIANIYNRLKNAVTQCSDKLEFSRHPRFGWLTFCPTNLGTTIRASVMIKVPKLAAKENALQELADKFNLQIRGTHGEHSEAVDGMYEISNKRRLGLTEFEAVKEMYDGISEIIKTEKSME